MPRVAAIKLASGIMDVAPQLPTLFRTHASGRRRILTRRHLLLRLLWRHQESPPISVAALIKPAAMTHLGLGGNEDKQRARRRHQLQETRFRHDPAPIRNNHSEQAAF